MVVTYYDHKNKKMIAHEYENKQEPQIKDGAKWYHFIDYENKDGFKKVCYKLICITETVAQARDYVKQHYSEIKQELPKWCELDNKLESTETELEEVETSLW